MNVDIVYIIVLYIMTLHALCNIVHFSYDIPVTTYITKQSWNHLEPSKDCNSSSKPSHVLPELQWSRLHQLSNIANFLLRISQGTAPSKMVIFFENGHFFENLHSSKLTNFHQNFLFGTQNMIMRQNYNVTLNYENNSK